MMKWKCVLVLGIVLSGAPLIAGAEEFFTQNFLMTHGSATVDGVISPGEWDAAGWLQLDQIYYSAGAGPTDLSEAKYAVYWNGEEEKFYCVVTGKDTSHVFADTYTAWNANDTIEVYTDASNSNGPMTDADQTLTQQWLATAMTDTTQSNLWSRSGQEIPESLRPDMALVVDGDWITCEMAIPAYSYYDAGTPENSTIQDLVGGATVGFDVVMNTRVNTTDFGMKSNNMVTAKSTGGARMQNWTLYTIPGDLNGDCAVNSSDLDIIRANWGTTGDQNDFTIGDANGDGMINSSDLDVIRANWGAQCPSAARAVPEPATLLLIALLGLFAGCRRRG